MKRARFMKPACCPAKIWGLCLLGLLTGLPARAQQLDPFLPGYDFGTARQPGSPRFFRLGALAGFSLSAEFGISPQFDISRSRPGPAGVSGADHFYDDGYVRVDATGNAQGVTTFWGYENPAAQDPQDGTLIMHSVRSFSATESATSKGDTAAVGMELVYGGLPWRHNEAQVGWEFGFGYLPISVDANHAMVGTVTRTVHRYQTGGIILPGAPYAGGESGIGPVIEDTPEALADDGGPASLAGHQTLDTDLFLFRLGPTIHWDMESRLALAVSVGAAVGFLNGGIKYHDTLTVDADGSTALNSGRIKDSDVSFGGYVSTTLTYNVEDHGDVYLSLQYLPMSSFTIAGGGRRAELDMTGSVFISAGFHWGF